MTARATLTTAIRLVTSGARGPRPAREAGPVERARAHPRTRPAREAGPVERARARGRPRPAREAGARMEPIPYRSPTHLRQPPPPRRASMGPKAATQAE